MKICFLSDIHNHQDLWEKRMFQQGALSEVATCDVIVFSGDMTESGLASEARQFLSWFANFYNWIPKIFIAGNHDYYFDTNYTSRPRAGYYPKRTTNFTTSDIQALIDEVNEFDNLYYLNDSSITIEGVKFHGSPITPWFHDWAFNRWPDEIQAHWDMIPEDTDVLITHGPPYKILDKILPKFQRNNEDPNVGCKLLLDRIKVVNPKISVFGHIHEGYGTYKDEISGILFINASSLDGDYQAVNAPIIAKL